MVDRQSEERDRVLDTREDDGRDRTDSGRRKAGQNGRGHLAGVLTQPASRAVAAAVSPWGHGRRALPATLSMARRLGPLRSGPHGMAGMRSSHQAEADQEQEDEGR